MSAFPDFGPNCVVNEELPPGGMGRVFRVAYNGRPAIAKLLDIALRRSEYLSDLVAQNTPGRVHIAEAFVKELRKRFLLEFRVGKSVYEEFAGRDDAFFPQYFTSGQLNDPDQSPYFVMEEFVADSAKYMARHAAQRPEPRVLLIRALQVCHQVAQSLCLLHGKRRQGYLVHRDIKPANIFMASNDDAHLGDFGIVQVETRVIAQYLGTNSNPAKNPAGTAWFSPRENFDGAVSPSSDIYSLGRTLLWFVQRIPEAGPFDVDGEMINGYPSDAAPPDIPQGVWRGALQLINGMTQADPAARMTASQVRVELQWLSRVAASSGLAQSLRDRLINFANAALTWERADRSSSSWTRGFEEVGRMNPFPPLCQAEKDYLRCVTEQTVRPPAAHEPDTEVWADSAPLRGALQQATAEAEAARIQLQETNDRLRDANRRLMRGRALQAALTGAVLVLAVAFGTAAVYSRVELKARRSREGTIAAMDRDIAQKNKQVNQYEAEKKLLENDLTKTRTEVADANRALAAQNAELEKKRGEVTQKQSEIERKEKQIRDDTKAAHEQHKVDAERYGKEIQNNQQCNREKRACGEALNECEETEVPRANARGGEWMKAQLCASDELDLCRREVSRGRTTLSRKCEGDAGVRVVAEGAELCESGKTCVSPAALCQGTCVSCPGGAAPQCVAPGTTEPAPSTQ